VICLICSDLLPENSTIRRSKEWEQSSLVFPTILAKLSYRRGVKSLGRLLPQSGGRRRRWGEEIHPLKFGVAKPRIRARLRCPPDTGARSAGGVRRRVG
jgi:hypothetical protein